MSWGAGAGQFESKGKKGEDVILKKSSFYALIIRETGPWGWYRIQDLLREFVLF